MSTAHTLYAIIMEFGCPFCPSKSLDSLGHNALTGKFNDDVFSRHNMFRDPFCEFCRQAGIGGKMEVGSGLRHVAQCTWPADVLVPNWVPGKPAVITADFALL